MEVGGQGIAIARRCVARPDRTMRIAEADSVRLRGFLLEVFCGRGFSPDAFRSNHRGGSKSIGAEALPQRHRGRIPQPASPDNLPTCTSPAAERGATLGTSPLPWFVPCVLRFSPSVLSRP
ncbi:hypothetical protein [Lysobacter gummosus]|uniref:hypothetical protein n=1 Tax=Lysobacter gummosus TaxID=262324 RepID=UPI003628CABC